MAVLAISTSCSASHTGVITARASGTRPLALTLYDGNGNLLAEYFANAATRTFSVTQLPDGALLPNGTYTLELADGDGATTQAPATVACTPDPGTCDLSLTSVVATAPTTRTGTGAVAFTLGTTATTGSALLLTADGSPVSYNVSGVPAGNYAYYGLAPGDYLLRCYDSRSCTLPDRAFTIPAYAKAGCTDPTAANYDPAATDDDGTCAYNPPVWEAVGGVLSNPVLLPVPVALTTEEGPRPGLYVEVELQRGGVTFAALRKVPRTGQDTVDAAPYLRAELVALQRYAPRVPTQTDADGALRYTYQYRAVDADGPEPWQTRPGQRFAVLAAPQSLSGDLSAYVAGSAAPGRFTSAFPMPTHCVGYPLEVSVLLPERPVGVTLYAELRYLDAAGAELEIRSYPIAPTEPAGYLRVALPDNPLPCAAAVEVALVDEDRSYAGECVDGGTSGPGGGGLLVVNGGFLKL